MPFEEFGLTEARIVIEGTRISESGRSYAVSIPSDSGGILAKVELNTGVDIPLDTRLGQNLRSVLESRYREGYVEHEYKGTRLILSICGPFPGTQGTNNAINSLVHEADLIYDATMRLGGSYLAALGDVVLRRPL